VWIGRKSQGNPRVEVFASSGATLRILRLSLLLADLMHLMISCHPFYLAREISTVIKTAVYIPPQADNDIALSAL